MTKSMVVPLFVVLGLLYVVTEYHLFDFSSDKDSDKSEVSYYKYNAKDSIGTKILDLREENASIQFKVWNHSSLKKEFFTLFPNFNDMRYFIEMHLRAPDVSRYLLNAIDKIENDFFSGKITTEEARRKFRFLKYK